jgi:DNA modification methylase
MIKPYYQDSHVTIYHGDCREILPELPKVDLVFTSPPYWKQRDYELEDFDWTRTVPPVLGSFHLSGSQILVNLGLIHIKGEVFEYWNILIGAMRERGYRLFGWYVWDKLRGLPGDSNGRFAPSFEFIFHFNKNACEVNKIIPTQESSRKKYPPKTALRQKDGKVRKLTSPDKCGQDWKIPDSTIRLYPQLARGGFADDHPAPFPIELPKFIISAFPGETILDPFAGSCTTGRAAKDLNRKCICIEIEEKYCEIGANRMKQEVLAL